MEALPENDGSGGYRFKLGPVEKWLITAGAAVLLGVGYWAAATVNGQLADTSAKLNTLITQQAVTNNQLTTLTLQMADVPQLRTKVTTLEVRVEQLEKRQQELRDMRGLR